jgi:flavin-dependent dehydrogenase
MEARHFDADVLIGGGGPAGAAAAIACAMRGLSVILCERDVFARERPGETLHPGIEPLLAQLGVAERLDDVVGARHSGIWIEWGGPRRFEPFGSDASGPWSGFQVWRADFDALLLARARELGVDVRQPCGVSAITAREEGSATVATSEGPVTARILIDATGRSRWLGRALGIASPPRSPQLLARYGYAEGLCPARDDAPLLIGDASGWTWTARVRPNIYQWTHLSFDGSQPDPAWMPDEFRGLAARGPSRGADVTWRMAERAADAGWFMAGDAAAILDPTSSHGVLKAIVSGMMAGHLIAAVIKGMAPADEAAAVYRQWLAGWFAADAERLTRFYRELGMTAFG